MSTFALVHGAWGSGADWALVAAELERMGHSAVAPDLPSEDPDATFDDYAAVVLAALADVDGDVVVVGHSLGGHTAPLVAARRPVARLVYVAALLPEPGLSLRDQFRRGDRALVPDSERGLSAPDELNRTRWVDFDGYRAALCDDCDEATAREWFGRSRRQARRPHGEPCSLVALPTVPTEYVLCRGDRIVDSSFWREAVPERLGITPLELDGSHFPMASRPEELALLLSARGA